MKCPKEQVIKMVSNDHIALILFKAFQLILVVQVHLKIVFSYMQRKKTNQQTVGDLIRT